MNLLVRLNEELGKTLIMVTHDAATAEYAGLTLHLDKGQLAEQSVTAAFSGETATTRANEGSDA